MIKVGIVGGAGYTAGELIRVLLHHPNVAFGFITSKSHAGQPISDVHTDLVGCTELSFSAGIEDSVDVVFLCVGHGHAATFLEGSALPAETKIIDLSQDHRYSDETWLYGLAEMNAGQIKSASKVANPGCFATAIQLALLPLAQAQKLTEDVHIHAITGSTGAGQSPSPTSHFSWRNDNVSIYKAFQHQHMYEVQESLKAQQAAAIPAINFIPVRGNFSRGIFASTYTKTTLSLAEAKALYAEFYADAPFTTLSQNPLHLKQAVNTNRCLLHLEKHGDNLLVTSIIDNLLKGASGQAVQNMNLMFGLPETSGLNLKSNAF
jgi:N-acetyl-gamma-glutamyl-phosphate reductase